MARPQSFPSSRAKSAEVPDEYTVGGTVTVRVYPGRVRRLCETCKQMGLSACKHIEAVEVYVAGTVVPD